jgi:hypothetical protein
MVAVYEVMAVVTAAPALVSQVGVTEYTFKLNEGVKVEGSKVATVGVTSVPSQVIALIVVVPFWNLYATPLLKAPVVVVFNPAGVSLYEVMTLCNAAPALVRKAGVME